MRFVVLGSTLPRPISPPSPRLLDCFLIIVQCAFAVHFVRLSKLLSPFFFFCPSRHSRQKRHTDNDKSNCQWLVVLLLYIFCPSSVCASVCVRVCGSWASCALCQKATVSLLNVSLCLLLPFLPLLASFLPLSVCCLLILCVCCCCLGQLAAVSCRLPLLVASNRINMLPMSVAAAYFKSKQAMFFLKPPPTQTHTQTVDIVASGEERARGDERREKSKRKRQSKRRHCLTED